MIDRRRLLCASAMAAVAAGVVPRALSAGSGSAAPLRLASVIYGSLSWVIETIRVLELDKKVGLSLEVVEVASNQAGPIALLGGGADVIVSDWTWAMRQRALGEKLRFAPYSSALGALVVPNDSDIKTIADLERRQLGVAGSAIDKSWLLLRAYSQQMIGRDMARYANASYGAAPLLNEELRSGRIEAVLNYWTYAARLTGSGYREILTVDHIMKALGVDPVPSLVGFVWKESYEVANGADLQKLLDAVSDANTVLATDDSAWERLRPLVKPADDGEFEAIIAAYRAGIPEPWGPKEVESAKKLMDVLIEAGDTELMGFGTKFDPQLFHHAAS